jgi:hypothetical protein
VKKVKNVLKLMFFGGSENKKKGRCFVVEALATFCKKLSPYFYFSEKKKKKKS